RQDNVAPKRALLLRCEAQGTRWDIWDITPAQASGAFAKLDHPGGLQADGMRLWIPVAESVRHGKSVIRAFPLQGLVPGQIASPEIEFPVNDHIGAVAVSTERRLILGASWDTENVYVWNLDGRLQRTLTGAELKGRNLSSISGPDGRAG